MRSHGRVSPRMRSRQPAYQQHTVAGVLEAAPLTMRLARRALGETWAVQLAHEPIPDLAAR